MAESRDVRIAVIGAGLGGTAVAGLLEREGYRVDVYEQAPGFSRLGAGIHLSPNVTRVLERLGVCDQLVATGISPDAWVSRAWDTGEVTQELTLGERALRRYGAPYLTVHRGDFHATLTSAVSPGTIHFGKRLAGVDQGPSSVRLAFADGSQAECDILIGADGVNSQVREILLGPEKPVYTGYVAHRSVFPVSLLGGLDLRDCTKWWSPDRHIIIYFVTHARDEIYFVSGVPQAEWTAEGSFVEGSKEQLIADFEGFHPEVQHILKASPSVSNWALLERAPLPLWSQDRIVLLGDACHPMKPHMGQGAAMAIEDAAMLVRCLKAAPGDFRTAFQLYEANRLPRTADVQHTSHLNTWLRDDTDPDWVFGYDVFDVPLARPGSAASAR